MIQSGKYTKTRCAHTGQSRGTLALHRQAPCAGALMLSAAPRPFAIPPATVSRRRFIIAKNKPKPKNRIQQERTAQKRAKNLGQGKMS